MTYDELSFVRCADSPTGRHEWVSAWIDGRRPCKHCGLSGAENFQAATMARTERFATLRAPKSAHGGTKKTYA